MDISNKLESYMINNGKIPFLDIEQDEKEIVSSKLLYLLQQVFEYGQDVNTIIHNVDVLQHITGDVAFYYALERTINVAFAVTRYTYQYESMYKIIAAVKLIPRLKCIDACNGVILEMNKSMDFFLDKSSSKTVYEVHAANIIRAFVESEVPFDLIDRKYVKCFIKVYNDQLDKFPPHMVLQLV